MKTAQEHFNEGNKKTIGKDFLGAISDYTNAIDIIPNDEYYYFRGKAKMEIKDFESAITDFTKDLKIRCNYVKSYFKKELVKYAPNENINANDNYINVGEIHANDACSFFYRGNANYLLKNYKHAISDFNEIIKIDFNKNDYFTYYTIRTGDHRGSIAEITNLMKYNRKDDWLYYSRGKAQMEIKDYTSAIADFNQAIKIRPNYGEAYYFKGQSNIESKNYKEAISDLTIVLEMHSVNVGAYCLRGKAKSELKDYVGAIDDYTAATEINPNFPNAYYYRGYAKNKRNDYQGAIEDINKTMMLYPEHIMTEAHRNSGNIRTALEVYQNRIANLTMTKTIDSKNFEAYYVHEFSKLVLSQKAHGNYDLSKTEKIMTDMQSG